MIGELIKLHRTVRGISQGDLAERVGCSPATILNFERGHKDAITIVHLARIARSLDMDVEDLVTFETEKRLKPKAKKRKGKK